MSSRFFFSPSFLPLMIPKFAACPIIAAAFQMCLSIYLFIVVVVTIWAA